MDPAAAMKMMQNMSPEQRQNMMGMFQNMDPSVIAGMAKNMQMPGGGQMDEAKVRQAQEAMKANPNAMDSAMDPKRLNAASKYLEDGVARMKADGNASWKAKKYPEAVELYERAIKQMEEVMAPSELGAKNLKACRLNATLCYLSMEKGMDKAVKHCSDVIKTYQTDTKALYRRGLCYEKQGNLEASLADIKASLEWSAAQEPVMVEAAERVEKAMAATTGGKAVEDVADVADVQSEPAWETAPRKTLDEMSSDAKPAAAAGKAGKAGKAAAKDEAKATTPKAATSAADTKGKAAAKAPAASAAKSSGDSGKKSAAEASKSAGKSAVKQGFDRTSINKSASKPGPMPGMPGGVPPQINPDQMKQATSMIDNMEPEQLEQMMKAQAGMMGGNMPPGMNMSGENLKAASQMMKNMSPDQMNDMMKMAAPMMESMGKGRAAPGAGSAATGASTTTATGSTNNAMAASGGMPGGMPPGMGSPDQAAMAQQMMANMSPDQMSDMMKMAGPMMESMSKNGMGAPGAGGMPDQAAMAKMAEDMQKNPEMMKNMTNMVKNIDPKMMAQMSQQAGMGMTEEQAAQMTDKMKDLTPEQMATMMKMAGRMKWFWDVMMACYTMFFGTMMRMAASFAMIVMFFGWLFGYM